MEKSADHQQSKIEELQNEELPKIQEEDDIPGHSKATIHREMSPKNDLHPSPTAAEEADLQEISAVNDSLDELSSVLDSFEQRTDNIIEQLKELLDSNRAIRLEIAMEKAAMAAGSGDAMKVETVTMDNDEAAPEGAEKPKDDVEMNE